MNNFRENHRLIRRTPLMFKKLEGLKHIELKTLIGLVSCNQEALCASLILNKSNIFR